MPASFVARLEASPEGGYVATVPSLMGCISEGETKEQAIENIKDAYLAYILAAKSMGFSLPRRRLGRGEIGAKEILVELDGEL